MSQTPSLADRLLDAQVAWALDLLTGDQVQEVVARDVDDLLAVAGALRLDAVVDPDEIKRVARRLVATVPSSAAAGELVRSATTVIYQGPDEPVAVSDLIAREQVEALVDEVMGATHLAKDALDQLAESPLVATVASRFVGRLVGEVLQANQAVADKIPGLGSLMSLGTSAASRVMGAADKQFEALLGDTAGKSATFAVRRLNKIVLETLQDPTTKAAVLQVWDLYADKPIGSMSEYADEDGVHQFVSVIQQIVATAATSDHAAGLADALVDGFFGVYGEYPITTLLEELELTRDDLVADAQSFATTALAAAHESGQLEGLIRDRLEPFFRSPAVAEILGG
jgi:hypothetical protein